jgi:hypothetical protein
MDGSEGERGGGDEALAIPVEGLQARRDQDGGDRDAAWSLLLDPGHESVVRTGGSRAEPIQVDASRGRAT